jgi:plasmid stability protein
MSYTVHMRTTTLTIRTDETLREALAKRAALQGKTVSELAREILSEAVAERPLGERTGHLRGQLDLGSAGADLWRQHLKERNWRR